MRSFSLLFVVLAACGGSKKQPTTPITQVGDEGTTPSEQSSTVKAVLHYQLEVEVQEIDPPNSVVHLVETNELGASSRENLGTFEGSCRDVTKEVRQTDEVLLAFHCQPSGSQRGSIVHILNRRGQLVLLRAWLGATKPTFDEFDQIGSLAPHTAGVPLTTDHD